MSDDLLKALPGRDLRIYCVWTPVLLTDTKASAVRNELSMKRRRLRHYWDHQQLLARHLAGHLGVELAWDVYLLYQRGEMNLEQPGFWMHQLETDRAPRLNVGILRDKVLELLA